MAIEEIRGKHFRWLDITKGKDLNSPEIKFLKKNFRFHQLNLRDCATYNQRPKIDVYRDYLFLVMLYPIYNRQTGEIYTSEIDIFIDKDHIITIHDKKLSILVNFFNHLKKTKHEREKDEFFSQNVIIILYEVLNKLASHCLPMLDHISLDIHKAEKNIFQHREMDTLEKILCSRRNIVNFRKSMQAHKNILKKLAQANREMKLLDPVKADLYFNNLIEKTKEIWESLDSFKESIEALHGTNESLISFRLNQIMKTFTSISVVIFFLTLVATLFSIRAKHTPLISMPFGFWGILFLEIILAWLVLKFFKRRKWLE